MTFRHAAIAGTALLLIGFLLPQPNRAADIRLPPIDENSPITIDGSSAMRWRQGADDVLVVKDCVVNQGQMTARGDLAVLWLDVAPAGSGSVSHVTVYLEGSAAVDFRRGGSPNRATGQPAQSVRNRTWFGHLTTRAPIEVRARVDVEDPRVKPAVYERAQQAWDVDAGNVQLAQFNAEPLAPPPLAPLAMGNKTIQVSPRSNALIHMKSFPGTVPNQSVLVFTNGLRAVITGVQMPQLGNLGRIVIETDRLVVWGPRPKNLGAAGSEIEGTAEVPIEVYLEGNVVFRQGDRLIYADRMYYNATHEYGVVLSAEVYTPVPQFDGIMRLKADVLQQLNDQLFEAYGGAVTSSRMGVPSYWMQAQRITLRDKHQPRVNPLTGQLELDPHTGEAAVDHDLLATSHNNFLYASGIPLFYWPVMATNLRKPSYYVDRFSLKSDDIFGTQVLTDWDLFQLLKIKDPPEGTHWTLSTDYLSQRGIALGTTFDYQQTSFLSFPGPVRGWLDAWGLYDDGLDDLGQSRKNIPPEANPRGRIYWRHRQDLPEGFQFTAQVGLASDRNFIEEYFEKEWDEWKDQVTSLQLKKTFEDQSLRVLGQVRLNDFVTRSEWFPRLDHFLVGRSFLHDHLTWYAHTHGSYTRLRIAGTPRDPADRVGWALMPWEQEVEGVRGVTRQEVDLPLQAGWLKIVPYALGEIGYWGQVLDGGEDVSRAFGQAGVRASVPIWRADPTVQNLLFNLTGIAHKITLRADLFWSDASQDLSRFPLYDPADDDSQERFHRFLGGMVPLRYDERNFLFRSRAQGWVTSPNTEIVDDLMQARLGIHQRWQTKRGLPGQQRVVDWITLDVDGSVFPDPDRDNFGEYLGQLQHYFRWHVGDRVTVLSDGYTDLFDGGLKAYSLGGAISRPGRGQVYSGIVSMQGPFNSTLLVTALSYRMSEKWIADLSSTYDLGPTGNIGEAFGFTRIGEAVLVRLGFYADHSRDNVGLRFQIEPRFMPVRRLGRGLVTGPAGMLALE